MAAAVVLPHSFVERGVGRRSHRFPDEITSIDTSAAQIQTASTIDDTADVSSYDVRDGTKGRFGGDAGDKACGGVFLRHIISFFEASEPSAVLLWDGFFLRGLRCGDEDLRGAAKPFYGRNS